eukprot:TRINITY_DN4095_c0_g1_i1.p1 TRINITY_DN4095_c0_g1~~TRINITY_DN4095_c0_g1_i1.p1  ORF type:complete len:216 (-),score=49.82 TRINITY_DN4095_c0_g1_i1:61-708(-)
MSGHKIELYSYWRSSAAWRVRIVLAWKGLEYTYHPVNLLKGGNHEEAYVSLHPMHQVPSMIFDGKVLLQSYSIVEFLEETFPEPHLLPKDPFLRQKVREIALDIVADIHPVQNQSVLARVGAAQGEEAKKEWAKWAISRIFNGLEKVLEKSSGRFCVGDEVSLADVCLIPQVYNGYRWGVDMQKYPVILRIVAECEKLEPFQKAHPTVQPDFEKI